MGNIQGGFRMPVGMAGMMVCRLLIAFAFAAIAVRGWGMSLARMPLAETIKMSDCVVQGVIEQTTATAYTGVRGPGMSATHSHLRIKVRVLHSVPAVAVHSIIVAGDGQPTLFVPGTMLVICLKRAGVEYRPIFSLLAQGVYPFYQSEGMTVVSFGSPGFVLVGQEAAWGHVVAMHDEVSGKYADTTKTLARVEKLKNGSLTDAGLAFELLTVKGAQGLKGSDLVDALENQYRRVMVAIPPRPDSVERAHGNQVDSYRDLARYILKILPTVAADADVSRTLDLFIKDRSANNAQIFDDSTFNESMMQLILSKPGPQRDARINRVLGQRVNFLDSKGRQIGSAILIPATADPRARE